MMKINAKNLAHAILKARDPDFPGDITTIPLRSTEDVYKEINYAETANTGTDAPYTVVTLTAIAVRHRNGDIILEWDVEI